MDLSRLVSAFCPTAYADSALRARFVTALYTGAHWNEPWTSPLPKPRETNLLFLFRSLANIFQDGVVMDDGAWVQEVCMLRLPLLDRRHSCFMSRIWICLADHHT